MRYLVNFFPVKSLAVTGKLFIFAPVLRKPAEIAQLVEHNLAKVRVASSSLVFRSFFERMLEWWNGRHEGLKILWPLRLCGFKSRFEYRSNPLIACKSMFAGDFLFIAETFLKLFLLLNTARVKVGYWESRAK